MDDLARWTQSLPAAWTEGCGEALFRAAHECYQSPGRVYHSWNHLLDCADKLRTFSCDSSQEVFLALLFHDAIYVVGSPTNEERSAAEAKRLLEIHSSIGPAQIGRISQYILATRDHRLPPGESPGDLQVTLDIDMSILGAAPDVYRDYASGVRREYCH